MIEAGLIRVGLLCGRFEEPCESLHLLTSGFNFAQDSDIVAACG